MLPESRDRAASRSNFPRPHVRIARLATAVRRQRRIALLALILCLIGGVIYAALTPRRYAATARLMVLPTDAPAVDPAPAEAVLSPAVLGRALASPDVQSLAMFGAAVAADDSLAALMSMARVTPGERDDFIALTVEADSPADAAVLANALAQAYADEAADRVHTAARKSLAKLMPARDAARQSREVRLAALADYRKRRAGSNDAIGTVRGASRPLSIAEVQARIDAVQAAVADPARLHMLIDSLPIDGASYGGQEYQNARQQLTRQKMLLWANDSLLGVNHPSMQATRSTVAALERTVADKEQAIARAYLAELEVARSAALATAAPAAAFTAAGDAVSIVDAAAYDRAEIEAADFQRQAEHLAAEIDQLQARANLAPTAVVRLLDPALPPDSPVTLHAGWILAIAAGVGAALGVGLAALRDRAAFSRSPLPPPTLNITITTLPGMPIVGAVPRMHERLSTLERGRVVHEFGHSPAGVAFTAMRAALDAGPARDARTVLVTSPTSGDGRSTVAANLAIAYATAGHRTLLVDCDLRRPTQHLIFDAGSAVGFTDVVRDEARLRDAVCSTSTRDLYLLPCGAPPTDPSDMLASKRFLRLMHTVAGGTFDRVVIDCPPLASETDARILAAGADVTVLVMRAGESMRKLGSMARAALEKVGATVVGMVVNDPGEAAFGFDRPRRPTGSAFSNQAVKHSRRRDRTDGRSLFTALARLNTPTTPGGCGLDIPEPDWSADESTSTIHAEPARGHVHADGISKPSDDCHTACFSVRLIGPTAVCDSVCKAGDSLS